MWSSLTTGHYGYQSPACHWGAAMRSAPCALVSGREQARAAVRSVVRVDLASILELESQSPLCLFSTQHLAQTLQHDDVHCSSEKHTRPYKRHSVVSDVWSSTEKLGCTSSGEVLAVDGRQYACIGCGNVGTRLAVSEHLKIQTKRENFMFTNDPLKGRTDY